MAAERSASRRVSRPPTTSDELFAQLAADGRGCGPDGSGPASAPASASAVEEERAAWPVVDAAAAEVPVVSPADVIARPQPSPEARGARMAALIASSRRGTLRPPPDDGPAEPGPPPAADAAAARDPDGPPSAVREEMRRDVDLGAESLDALSERVTALAFKLRLGDAPEGIDLAFDDAADAGPQPDARAAASPELPPNAQAAPPAAGMPTRNRILSPSKKIPSPAAEAPKPGSDTFITEVNLPPKMTLKEAKMRLERMRKMEADKEMKLRAQMLEHAEFPGFTHGSPSPLPNETRVDAAVRKAVSLHELPAGPLRSLNKWIHTPTSYCLMQDMFWWCFLHWYKPHPEAEASLFGRMAGNYVRMYRTVDARHRDAVLQVYPDVLAQSIYLAYTEGFPKSPERFDAGFRENLCDQVFEWMTGIRPRELSCEHWAAECVPRIIPTASAAAGGGGAGAGASGPNGDGHSRHGGGGGADGRPAESDGRTMGVRLTANFDDELFKKIDKEIHEAQSLQAQADARQTRAKAVEPSCYVGPSPATSRKWFDIYGNSPLVAHYLAVSNSGGREQRIVLIHRSEVARETRRPGDPTYRDVVGESVRASRLGFRRHAAAYDQITRERCGLARALAGEMRRLTGLQRRALGRSADVKRISDTICDAQMANVPDSAVSAHLQKKKRRSNLGPKKFNRADGSQQTIVVQVDAAPLN